MPPASREYSACWICRGSCSGIDRSEPLRAQYPITIASEAAPHPFFSCFTKGTSSQIAPSAHAAHANRQPHTTTLRSRSMDFRLLGSDDHQDDDSCGQSDQNVGDLLVTQSTGGELVLNLVALRRQARHLLIIQQRDCA